MRKRAALSAFGLALALSGCGIVHVTSSRPPAIDRSRLVDNTLHLDLRRHPTRDDLGMNPTTSFAGYGSTDHPIQAVVDVPGATLTFPRTDITFATDDAGGAIDPSPAAHEPRFFTLYVHYPDRDAARADAVAKAPALGLRTDQVDAALRNPSGLHDEYGVPDDWLSARMGFNHGSDDPSYTAFYFFDLDVYHNPVVDKIKSGDAVVLDLREDPTRSALGFLPGYNTSTIWSDPGHRLTLDLRTTAGRGSMRLSEGAAVLSSADGPDGPPTSSYLTVCDPPARLRSGLLDVADALGLDRDRVDALPTSTSRRSPALTLSGRTSTLVARIKYSGVDGTAREPCVGVNLEYVR